MKYFPIGLFLLVPFNGVADEQPQSDPVFEHMQLVGNFVSQAASLVRNKNETELEKLGAINTKKIEPTTVPNAPADEKWTYQTIVYSGLTIKGDVGPDGVFYPTYMGISDKHWKLPLGLSIGSSLNDVTAALGQPDSATESELTYADEADTVTIHLKNKKIESIEFDLYLD